MKSSTRAVEVIRRGILAGDLQPGQRLKLADLALQYDVGQMPVREALIHLEGEGLVELVANRGAVVRTVDAKFIHDRYEIRRVVEMMLVRNAVQSFREDQVVQLFRARDAWEAAAAAGDRQELSRTNVAFHDVINRAGNNPEAARLISRGWDLVMALRMRFGMGPSRLAAVAAEHREIADALKARDAARAVAAIEIHCTASRDDLLAQMA